MRHDWRGAERAIIVPDNPFAASQGRPLKQKQLRVAAGRHPRHSRAPYNMFIKNHASPHIRQHGVATGDSTIFLLLDLNGFVSIA